MLVVGCPWRRGSETGGFWQLLCFRKGADCVSTRNILNIQSSLVFNGTRRRETVYIHGRLMRLSMVCPTSQPGAGWEQHGDLHDLDPTPPNRVSSRIEIPIVAHPAWGCPWCTVQLTYGSAQSFVHVATRASNIWLSVQLRSQKNMECTW